MTVHQLSLQDARRIAVQAQLLDAPRPTDLLAVIHQLTLLQIDPTAAVAPNAHLVAWSRLGSAYQPAQTRRALEVDRTLFEFDAMIRPIERPAPLLPAAHRAPGTDTSTPRNWMAANDRFRLRRPGSAPRLRPARLARHPGHRPGAMAVKRLVAQPQRHPDARVPDDAGRSRDRRPARLGAGLGPRRAGVPRRPSWP